MYRLIHVKQKEKYMKSQVYLLVYMIDHDSTSPI